MLVFAIELKKLCYYWTFFSSSYKCLVFGPGHAQILAPPLHCHFNQNYQGITISSVDLERVNSQLHEK